MMDKLDHPALFALVMTLIVVAMTWLLYLGSKAAGIESVAKFLAGPKGE